ncbi:MAG: hypothetical protein ACE5FJ_02880 [Gemmatimonadales bacterium]
MKKTFILVGTIIVASGALGTFAVRRDAALLNESGERGAAVVTALQQFRSDSGYYPRSLGSLTPQYLVELPRPVWGLKRWRYHTTLDQIAETDSSRHGFELAVAANETLEPMLRFRTATNAWDMDD